MKNENNLFKITVRTFWGLEDVLFKELNHFGVTELEKGVRMVSGLCNLQKFYKVAYNSRFAIKVLKPIYEFTAYNEKQLYEQLYDCNWNKYFTPLKTMAISSTVYSEYFRNSQFVSYRTKDAIVDFFKNMAGKRPNISTEKTQIAINIHIKDEQVTVSMDVSYRSLHQRKYRYLDHAAPLNEVLAAGLIRLSGWRFEEPLVDPMCGTGTIPIEAAMMALNIPPRIYKKDWSLTHWKHFDVKLWEQTLQEGYDGIRKKKIFVYGFDINEKVLIDANSKMEKQKFVPLRFIQKDFFNSEPAFNNGVIITNPPYDHRVKTHIDINDYYKKLGDHLKQNYAGWRALIISGNLEAIKCIGLRTTKKHRLFNGGLPCQFNEYRLFKGARTDFLIDKNNVP